MKVTKWFLVVTVLLAMFSCSRLPNNDQIKSLILAKEQMDIDSNAISLFSPCGSGKALDVPKAFVYTISATTREPLSNEFYQTIMENQYKILTQLVTDSIIMMGKPNEKTIYHDKKPYTIRQEYPISLTEKGKTIATEENGAKYLLKLVDEKTLNIIQVFKIADDHVSVSYTMKHTPVYDALKKTCKDEKESFLIPETFSILLVHQNGEWVVSM